MDFFVNSRILILNNKDFDNVCEELKIDEQYAFVSEIDGSSTIIINKDLYDNLNEDEKIAIIAHECAHCEGIVNEELADKWVIDNIEKEGSKKIIIENWFMRHGQTYEEFLEKGII